MGGRDDLSPRIQDEGEAGKWDGGLHTGTAVDTLDDEGDDGGGALGADQVVEGQGEWVAGVWSGWGPR